MDPGGILRGAPVFGEVGADAIARLLPHVRERQFGRGEPVWVEGARSESLYVVAEGQLKTYRVSPGGAEVILELHSNGDLFGDVGLFHPSGHRLASVTAMEPSRCLTVARKPLLEFLSANPEAMRAMLERLSSAAGKAAFSLSGVAFDDIRSRVAKALLTLGDEFGEPAADGVRIRLRLSQGTLAALVAASRENVNRALSSLGVNGALSQQQGRFVLHDRAALEAASQPLAEL